VKQWVDYKLATLVYKSLQGQAPSYQVDDCQLIADSRRPSFARLTPTFSQLGEQALDLGNISFSVAVLEFETVYRLTLVA